MLKKLRLKFVAVIMVIVTVMLCAVFGTVYFQTKTNLESQSLNMMRNVMAKPIKLGPSNLPTDEVRLPFFSLQLNSDGQIIAEEGGYYDLSDEDFLNELIRVTLENGAETGTLEQYKLRFFRMELRDGQRIVFADISSEQNTLGSLLLTCVAIGVLSFFVFLLISLLLARWAVKPVDEAWKQQRQFVADASHELKTPLTVIMTNAELLQSADYDEASRSQFSDSILIMAKQMRSLLERLLELARADSGQSKTPFCKFDLGAMVSDALLPFEPVLFERGLTLRSEIESGVNVFGSEQKLRQVTDILLDNAQKYAAPPGEVVVSVKSAGKRQCRLSVASPGKALSAEELKDIFKRFYRADKARSRDGSFGLGLSIAESIAAEHRGSIRAESADGTNTFIVELPSQ